MIFEDAFRSMVLCMREGLEVWEKREALTTRSVLIDGGLVPLRGILCSDGWMVGVDPSGVGWVMPPSAVGAEA